MPAHVGTRAYTCPKVEAAISDLCLHAVLSCVACIGCICMSEGV